MVACFSPGFICYNVTMDQKELMERLRNPQKFRKQTQNQQVQESATSAAQNTSSSQKNNKMTMWVGGGIFFLVLVSLLFILTAQQRADNVSRSLDPTVLKGLVVDHTFSPNTGRKVIQISEGRERNVTVEQSGSMLPVISRYNFRALTQDNYETIGKAPFALSINVEANMQDPQLLRYLFNNDDMAKQFKARPDVAPWLATPESLANLAKQEEKLQRFFAQDIVQQVLASEKVLEALAGSRLFSYLLISKAAKYYREHPAEAAALINNSPTLRTLKQNPAVRKAVQENTYLKNISATLLK